MNIRTTVILLLLVLATAAVAYIVRTERLLEGKLLPADVPLLPLAVLEIEYVSVARDGRTIVCEKRGDQWVFSEPIRARADSEQVVDFISALMTLYREGSISPTEQKKRGLSLGDYGLAPPQATIVIGDGRKRYGLLLGGKAPIGDSLYVRLTREQDVVATGPAVLDRLPATVNDWRDRQLFDYHPSDVQRLRVKRDEGIVEFLRTDDGWRMGMPVEARADEDKVRELLDVVLSMRVSRFVTEVVGATVSYGLDADKAVSATVWGNDSDAGETVYLGAPTTENADEIYARHSAFATVCALPKDILDALGGSAVLMRDKRLVPIEVDAMAFIHVQAGEDVLELVRDDDGWRLKRPRQWAADAAAVDRLAQTLAGLEVVDFVPGIHTNLAAYGLARPALVVACADTVPAPAVEETSGAEPPSPQPSIPRLWIGQHQPGTNVVYAKFADGDSIFTVPSAVAPAVSVDPLLYRHRSVLALKADDVLGLAVVSGDRSEGVRRRDDSQWEAVPPETAAPRVEAITQVLDRLADLNVAYYVTTPGVPGAFGLEAATRHLTIGLSAERGIQKTLIFGNPAGTDGVYAMFRGQDVLFVLDRRVAAALTQDLLE